MGAAGREARAGFAAEKAELFARVVDVDVNVGGDLELGLQHLPHGLAAGRPVRRLEQLVGSLDRDLQAAPIGEEVFLLDAE